MDTELFLKFSDDLAKIRSLVNDENSKSLSALTILSEVDTSLAELVKQKHEELTQAITAFYQELEKPVIRIAAIGTTSSAKNSMLNFLCGTDLLPTDIQEKSAGITKIIHSSTPELIIDNTRGAIWNIGKIAVKGADEIRGILNEIMDIYRKLIQNGKELEPPAFIIRYPLYLWKALNLPEGFDLELLDLPGLKYTGDERNRKVMAECKESLCLVAFGAHETDPIKQEVFLNSAMEQISLINAPLERMFFVATRIDDFLLRGKRNWPQNEQAYLDERLSAIKGKIIAVYGKNAADSIVLHKLSPLPALYALQMLEEAEIEKILPVWKNIRNSFLGLVEGGRDGDSDKGVDLDLLPGFANWTQDDRIAVAEQLWVTTGAAQFMEALHQRLALNLPAIVVPPPYARFSAVARDIDNWFNSGVELARSHIHNDVKRYLDLLDTALSEQEAINQAGSQELENFLHVWSKLVFQDSFSGNANYEDWRTLWANFPRFKSASLDESEKWGESLREAFLAPIDASISYWERGVPLLPSFPDRNLLFTAFQNLRTCLHSLFSKVWIREILINDSSDRVFIS